MSSPDYVISLNGGMSDLCLNYSKYELKVSVYLQIIPRASLSSMKLELNYSEHVSHCSDFTNCLLISLLSRRLLILLDDAITVLLVVVVHLEVDHLGQVHPGLGVGDLVPWLRAQLDMEPLLAIIHKSIVL